MLSMAVLYFEWPLNFFFEILCLMPLDPKSFGGRDDWERLFSSADTIHHQNRISILYV